MLFGNSSPLVYARSIIPNLTSSKGYPGLGSIGTKPLGDLLFQSKLFVKIGENLLNLRCLMARLFGAEEQIT